MPNDTKTDVTVEQQAIEVLEDQTVRVVDMTQFFQGLAFKARKRELDARPMLEPPRILKIRLTEVEEKVTRVHGTLQRSASARKGWETRRANALRRQQAAARAHAALWEPVRVLQKRLQRNPDARKRDDGIWICLPDRCFKIVGRGPGECAYCLTG